MHIGRVITFFDIAVNPMPGGNAQIGPARQSLSGVVGPARQSLSGEVGPARQSPSGEVGHDRASGILIIDTLSMVYQRSMPDIIFMPGRLPGSFETGACVQIHFKTRQPEEIRQKPEVNQKCRPRVISCQPEITGNNNSLDMD